jgi:hypothetical protein
MAESMVRPGGRGVWKRLSASGAKSRISEKYISKDEYPYLSAAWRHQVIIAYV